MMYYLSNENECMVVDLREVNSNDRYLYEMVLESHDYLEQESYEDNLYHIYIKTEGDWESVKELTVELDELQMAIDLEYEEDIPLEDTFNLFD